MLKYTVQHFNRLAAQAASDYLLLRDPPGLIIENIENIVNDEYVNSDDMEGNLELIDFTT